GTPGYMAPEQANSRAELTLSADVYSVGVVLYEMLAGRRPFDDSAGETDWVEVLVRQRTQVPPRLAEVGAALEAVVLRALAKDPAERFASAAEMRRALADLGD